MKNNRKITLHRWKPCLTSTDVARAAQGGAELFFSADALEHLDLEPQQFGPTKNGWIEIQDKQGEDCCATHPENPTVSGIRSRLLDDNETIVVAVTASHPCGIKQISVFMGELAWVRSPTGGRMRAPQVRLNPNDPAGAILDGTEETWTRGDSTDGTPVTLNAHFKMSLLHPEALNVWIVRIVNTCGVEATGHTEEFLPPVLGPF